MARNFVKLDRFAPFQIGRHNRLSAHERWLLVTLGLLADYRTSEWAGTLTFLAEEMGAGRKTVERAIRRLDALSLLEVLQPFGPNSEGRVRVICYPMLVVPRQTRYASNDASPPDSTRVEVASDSRPIRVVSASNDASPPAPTSQDANARGIEASREEGIDACSRCGASIALCMCPF